MVRTPLLPGPFCQIFSPGVNELDLPQNWHRGDHASCHICSSVKPGNGFGGLGESALRAEAHTDSDFRRRRHAESGLGTGTSCTSVRHERNDRLTCINRPRSASEQKRKTCCHTAGGSPAHGLKVLETGEKGERSLRFLSCAEESSSALRFAAAISRCAVFAVITGFGSVS